MSKKKREHVTFDRLSEKRKTVPFGKINRTTRKRPEKPKIVDKGGIKG